MHITAIETRRVVLPLPRPLRTSIHRIDSVGALLVRVKTNTELYGESYVFALNNRWLSVFDAVVDEYREFFIEHDPHDIGNIWQRIWQWLNPTGQAGVTISVLSALDVACWDIIGKAAKQPLHHLWGSRRNTIPTYASSGLWLDLDLDGLRAEATSFVAAGFTGMKLRISGAAAALPDTITRTAAVREAIGPDIGLYVDANQGSDAKTAGMLAQALQEYDVLWLEEPVDVNDLAGQAEARERSVLPIASGETVFGSVGIRRLAEAAAADIYMPDLQRIGGYSELRRAAEIVAPAPVSTHLFTEHSLVAAAALPNAISVEHMNWFAPLFKEPMELVGGELVVPERPGHGFGFGES